MTYKDTLRQLRGDRPQHEVARAAKLSASTMVKAESGPDEIKFATVAAIMRALGYRDNSRAMRDVALQWLGSISGLPLNTPDAQQALDDLLRQTTVQNRQLLDQLCDTIARSALSPNEILLLNWAASCPPAMEILSHARQLETNGASAVAQSKR